MAGVQPDAERRDRTSEPRDRGHRIPQHRIGSARREWMERQRGSDAVRVMRAIKTALDPQGLLNPGRVLPDA